VIRSLDSIVNLIREKWLDFKLATINPQAPHLHELLVARADITRPMAQKGKTR
jgi:hypothetical protein